MNKKKVLDLKKELIEKIRKNENIECEEVFILVLYLFEKFEELEKELEIINNNEKRESKKDFKNLLSYL